LRKEKDSEEIESIHKERRTRKRMKHYQDRIMIFLSIFIVVGIWISPGDAQESSSSRQEAPQQVSLSLPEAIQLALEKNFDIRIEHYEPKIAQENIYKAESAFAPELSADSSYTLNEASTPTTPKNTTAIEMGVEQQFKTGTSYQLKVQTTTSAVEAAKAATSNSSGITLTLTQSLLKNRGTAVNSAPIVIAEKNRELSVSTLKSKVIEIITDVQDTYWDLILARGVLDADRYSLQLANDQVKMNEAQVKVGTLAPIEVLQAKATAASREVQIISDEEEVRNVEDELKRLLNISENDPTWQAEILPTTAPNAEWQAVSLDESIQQALANREELKSLQTSLEIQDLSVNVAHNQLQPELNLEGTVGLTGTDESWGGSVGNLADFATYNMSVGLGFRYPLGNMAAKSEYAKAKLALDQTRLSMLNLEQQITTQVKKAVRAVETSYKQIEATKVALQLAEKQLEAEQKKFTEGLSTNFQVLDYQEKLATARSDSTKALASYRKALVALDQAVGTTLQQHDIVVNE
jgi:outer membrane protein TolC